MSIVRTPLEARLLSKLDRTGDCWIWTACTNHKGYGVISVGGKLKAAHRVAYEIYVGEIPSGMQIDHLCRVRACVKPSHLEPVTPKENTRRGIAAELREARYKSRTHCREGHPLFGDNLYVSTKQNGHRSRQCRTCRAAAMRRYFDRKKGVTS